MADQFVCPCELNIPVLADDIFVWPIDLDVRIDPRPVEPPAHPAHVCSRRNHERKAVADVEAAMRNQATGCGHTDDCCQAALLCKQRDHLGGTGCVLIHDNG